MSLPRAPHTAYGRRRAAVSTGATSDLCDRTGQPDADCRCPACVSWERATRPDVSTSLAGGAQ